ncbi:MAG: hypothetical protein M3547_01510 [Acidobacteriota bacterium]|nr:hypothetical protein [Acidobacteriota bacterium]
MLRIDKVETIEGLTVYDDDASPSTFYVVPDFPRFRIDDNGFPVFKFLKYRFPIDRPDGKKGGGYCFFDVEFVAPEDRLQKVKEVKQERVRKLFSSMGLPVPEAKIGVLTYTKGTSGMIIKEADGTIIQKIHNPGKPSLFGRNVTAFALELTPEGATLFEQALQGKGGVIGIFYDLHFWAKLPPILATGHFHADKFYSFYQTIDINENIWGSDEDYKETVREKFLSSESTRLDFEWGALTDEKLRGTIRDWVQRALEDAVERNMVEAIVPVSADDRKRPKGVDEDVVRDIQNHKISDVRVTYTEKLPVEWNIAPQGTLPNITSLKGPDGEPLVWSEYAQQVDLDDPFFKTLRVQVSVNADFKSLPLNSIDVHLQYEGETLKPSEQGANHFTSPDKVAKFAAFTKNNNWKYKYWYEVNYTGASKTFESEKIETDEQVQTINVDDVGCLTIDILAGDLNFEQVTQAQVTIEYEDQANGVSPIEAQFTIDTDHKEHRFQKLIFQPRRNQYRYRGKYFMADGKEFQTDWSQGRSPQLYIHDPFAATRTVGVRARGDLKNNIKTIFVDLKYSDEVNDYSQTKSAALSEAESFMDWSFPVISEKAGRVSYSGMIQYRNGTEEEVPETQVTGDTILVGPQVLGFLEVEVLPDLIDFNAVKLAKITLEYKDAENGVRDVKDVVFRADAKDPVAWKVELKDKAKPNYRWQAQFFLKDGSAKKTKWATTSEETVLPQWPE